MTMMKTYKEFMSQLDRLRSRLIGIMKRKQLTHIEIAKEIGIATGTLGCFLRNTRNPEFISLCRIEEYVLKNEESQVHKHKNPHEVVLCDICKDRRIREKIML